MSTDVLNETDNPELSSLYSYLYSIQCYRLPKCYNARSYYDKNMGLVIQILQYALTVRYFILSLFTCIYFADNIDIHVFLNFKQKTLS